MGSRVKQAQRKEAFEAKSYKPKPGLACEFSIAVLASLLGEPSFAGFNGRAIGVRPLGAASLAEPDAVEALAHAGGYDPCALEELAQFDTVEWIFQSYPDHENCHLRDERATPTVSDFSLHDPIMRRFYRISGTSGFGNEVFEYDETFIDIERETMHSSPQGFL